MASLDLQSMMNMQDELQEKYKGIWEAMEPSRSYFKVLWMMEEIGEVVAVLKKKTPSGIMEDPAVRAHFMEEMSDVLMYFVDTLSCLGISAEEFSSAYLEKHERNMHRDFVREHHDYLK